MPQDNQDFNNLLIISGRNYLELLYPNDVLKNYPKNRRFVTVNQRRIMGSIDILIEEIKIAQSLDEIDCFISSSSFVTITWIKNSLFSWSYKKFILGQAIDTKINIRPDVIKAFKKAYDLEQQQSQKKLPSSISDYQEIIELKSPPLSQEGVPDNFELRNVPLILPRNYNLHSEIQRAKKVVSPKTKKDNDYFADYRKEYEPIAFDLLKNSIMTYEEVASHHRMISKRKELLARDFPEPIDAEDRKIFRQLQTFPSARTIKRWKLDKAKKDVPPANSGKKKP